jgi:hypothetical protein
MTSTTMTPSFALVPSLVRAWPDVDSSFERFCLTAGIEAIDSRRNDRSPSWISLINPVTGLQPSSQTTLLCTPRSDRHLKRRGIRRA